MNVHGKERSLLRDLALIYITLAHGTDQDLSHAEVEEISRRLNAWQTHATEQTALSAIKNALESYTEDAAHGEVQEAVRRVRDEMSDEQLSRIVDDLTEIAMSDDKFLYEESAFIGDLARAWGVHGDDGERPWSVLTQNGSVRNGWSSLHDVALVYLHIAHRTDSDLDTREVETISGMLNEWMPDVTEADVLTVVQETMHAYVQGPDKRLFEDSVESLKNAIPLAQRAAIVGDLEQIARADGTVLPAEREVITRLSRAWGVEAG